MPKKNKYYDNLLKTILQFVEGKRYAPMGKAAILKKLNIPADLRPLCHDILADLVHKGILVLKNKKYAQKELEKELVTGTLRMHPRGFGFVQPDHLSEYPKEIFIPKHLSDNAVDGDTVEVEINPDSNWDKGPDGKIVSIVKRGRTHLGGTVHNIDAKGMLFVYCPLLGTSKPVVVDHGKKHKIGDRVILKILEWGDEEHLARGEISHYLGHISDPAVDIPAAVEEFDLRAAFPKGAIDEAKKWGKEVVKRDLKDREDLTTVTTITIDPETAKDFDDAISLTKDKKGIYHLGVHIADAAHYVFPGSALDKEAVLRCNSTYFPGSCLPMLPHELSDNLCSLKPDVVRLTVSVLADFDKNGNLINHRIVRSYIKSAKRFTYEEAKDVLDGKKKSPHLAMLKLTVELCALFKEKRSERGSIDFALPELVIVVDDKGKPTGTKYVEYDITHQLIEEFMLKANEIVAKTLSDRGKPVVFRIHEEPTKENIEEFYGLARSLGFSLPKAPTQQDLQELFEKAKSTPHGQQLSVGFIRSMKLAFYSKENVGHYGLALDYYCHFTSPIRRYTDLVIQRLLFNQEGKETDIDKIALKCSEQERISFRAESSVKTLKKFRLLEKWMKEDPQKSYQAVVTRVKPFGLSFELPSLMLEGFLHISELEDDYFMFNPQQTTLVGRSTGKTHRVGEPITVRPLTLDLILLESKWELITSRRRKR
jgi:ribonuclease R